MLLEAGFSSVNRRGLVGRTEPAHHRDPERSPVTGTAPARTRTPDTSTADGPTLAARRVPLPAGGADRPLRPGRRTTGSWWPTADGSSSGWARALEPSTCPAAWPTPTASTGPSPGWPRSGATTGSRRVRPALRPRPGLRRAPLRPPRAGHPRRALDAATAARPTAPSGSPWSADRPTRPRSSNPAAGLRDRLVATAASHATARSSEPTGPVGARVAPRSADADFEAAVARAVDAIDRDEVTKVVLARRVDVTLDRAPDVAGLLRRWAALEPSGTLFSLPTPDGQFIGASPELLVERDGRPRPQPPAGRDHRPVPRRRQPAARRAARVGQGRRGAPTGGRRHPRRCWPRGARRLVVPDGPELVHLHNLTHLGTTIDGTLRPGAGRSAPERPPPGGPPPPDPGRRRRAPGRGPRPDRPARGRRPGARTPGPVGYLDGAGDGRFVVGIRAMTVAGRHGHPDRRRRAWWPAPVPQTERDETDLKFRPSSTPWPRACPSTRPAVSATR